VLICLERGADLHMAQLMPLPLTVSCFSKIQIGFTFLLLAHPDSPGKGAVKWVCVCVCVTNKVLDMTLEENAEIHLPVSTVSRTLKLCLMFCLTLHDVVNRHATLRLCTLV